jgi:two-component system chemotaxis response regulator CheY
MDAIEAYKTSLNKENPYNLMVIDIMMPDMNGYDVLKKIREVEAERHIYFPFCAKIILTTGLDDDENRKIKQLLDADNEAYIPKSSYPETLIDKLNEFGFVLDLV